VPALDASQLARRQLELDRDRMREFPWLIPHKIELMQASPFGFLRGAAPLFYEILRAEPDLAKGPRGNGWITGDLHLENFGAFRHDSLEDPDVPRVLFNLNDFDEAVIGPWRFDVLRLLTSFLLTARGMGTPGLVSIGAARTMIDRYVGTATQAAKVPSPPAPVTSLMDKVRNRSRKELLDARTKLVRGKRRLKRGQKYRSLGGHLAGEARRAFAAYAARFEKLLEELPAALDIVDLAFRIAGTGSLGQLRVAVLVRGKGGPNGGWLFDMKEQRSPAPALVVPSPHMAPAERVVRALQACLEVPPQRIGTTQLDGRSMFVRRLAPQEDRINLSNLKFRDLSDVASYFGALTGAAHRRGSDGTEPLWNEGECEQLLDCALRMAGIHEETYYAFCLQTEVRTRRSSRLTTKWQSGPG
jgi:uncharacterized protein (DUF2252 family)